MFGHKKIKEDIERLKQEIAVLRSEYPKEKKEKELCVALPRLYKKTEYVPLWGEIESIHESVPISKAVKMLVEYLNIKYIDGEKVETNPKLIGGDSVKKKTAGKKMPKKPMGKKPC